MCIDQVRMMKGVDKNWQNIVEQNGHSATRLWQCTLLGASSILATVGIVTIRGQKMMKLTKGKP